MIQSDKQSIKTNILREHILNQSLQFEVGHLQQISFNCKLAITIQDVQDATAGLNAGIHWGSYLGTELFSTSLFSTPTFVNTP